MSSLSFRWVEQPGFSGRKVTCYLGKRDVGMVFGASPEGPWCIVAHLDRTLLVDYGGSCKRRLAEEAVERCIAKALAEPPETAA